MIKRQVQCTLLQFNVCVCCHISSLSTNSWNSLTSVVELEGAEFIYCKILNSRMSCFISIHFIWQHTLVGLSTRPAPLIISKSLQFWILWSQSKALFIIRCMLSVGRGSKTSGALKVTIHVKFFELSVHKMSNFLRISACQ